MSEFSFQKVVRTARPWALLAGLLFYAIGAGIWAFLGREIDWTAYLTGQVCVTMLQMSSYFLDAYFAAGPDDEARLRARRAREAELDPAEQQFVPRSVFMLTAATSLAIGAAMTALLYATGRMNPTALLFLGLALFVAFFFAVPPLRLVERGYGEITHAILVTSLVPALAYTLQAGELHRLLGMLSFPLLALYLAMTIAQSLESYFQDFKQERQTLLVRVGWQRGMGLHNWLIVAAYFLIALAALLNMPWSLTWPALLSLPVGLFQIWQMWRINQGAPPHWSLLRFTAGAAVGITAYLIAFALWIG